MEKLRGIWRLCAHLLLLLALAVSLPSPWLPFYWVRSLPPAHAVINVVHSEKYLGIWSAFFSAYGNAFLVDAPRGLYLTSAHLTLGAHVAVVESPGHSPSYVRTPLSWSNAAADLAIVQVIGPHDLGRVEACTLALDPPKQGEPLTVVRYKMVRQGLSPTPLFVGGEKPFVVLHSSSDGCVNERTCRNRDRLIEKVVLGESLTFDDLLFVSSSFSYVVYTGRESQGIVSGMSGSAVFNSENRVTGVVSSYFTFDPSGRYGRFSHAYLARELLTKAQADVDAGTVVP